MRNAEGYRNMNENQLDRVRKRLIQEEGLKLQLYHCTAGKLTIGVGRNVEDRGITHDTAMQMLDEDIDICVGELEKNLSWFEDAPDKIQEVLIDLCFNMGINRLMGFVKTLHKLKTGAYKEAAEELLDSRYASSVPNRAKRNADIIASME
jgi:lysozyme